MLGKKWNVSLDVVTPFISISLGHIFSKKVQLVDHAARNLRGRNVTTCASPLLAQVVPVNSLKIGG
jgi:hypothetical protein